VDDGCPFAMAPVLVRGRRGRQGKLDAARARYCAYWSWYSR
jgi:hypothetical protein